MWIPILISVEIRSYDSLSINKSKAAILAINRYIKGLLVNENTSNKRIEKYFSFPTKRKMFTVLRSPHIDKKSREHFQWKQSKMTLFLEFKKPGEWDLFLFILENARLPGVQLLVGCQYSTFCAFWPCFCWNSSLRPCFAHAKQVLTAGSVAWLTISEGRKKVVLLFTTDHNPCAALNASLCWPQVVLLGLQ